MIEANELSNALCRTFCSNVMVRAVPAGLAVSTVFSDRSGDRLTFYDVDGEDGIRLEDDGQYLADLIGFGVPIDQGTRGQLLDAILNDGEAYWDRDTFEVKTQSFSKEAITSKAIKFLSSLIRMRDLELLTRHIIRSTFREDVIRSLRSQLGDSAEILENQAVDSAFKEFPADLLIKPNGPGAWDGAVFLVNSDAKLNEALLLLMESRDQQRKDFKVIGLIEEPDMKQLSRRKFQRAQNRSLPMPIFRGDEEQSARFIARELNVSSMPVAAH